MTRFSNGFYTFSDSYLKNMRKQDLINYIRTIEKNWENQLITNDIQYSNCKRLLAEERNKAIDEFAERLKEKAEEIMQNPDIMLDCKKCTIWKVKDIDEIAERMKGGQDGIKF